MSLPEASDSVTVRWAGIVLAFVVGPGLLAWSTSFDPLLVGEGGGSTALSSGAPEHELVEASLIAVRDSLIAVLLALAGVGLGLGGLLMCVTGEVEDLTQLCMRGSLLALLLGLAAGTVFSLIDAPITTTPSSSAASGAALIPAGLAPAVAVPASAYSLGLIHKEGESQ